MTKRAIAPVERVTFTVNEFCEAHHISRAKLYSMWNAGTKVRLLVPPQSPHLVVGADFWCTGHI